MSAHRFTSSKTCAWNSPRPSPGSDADRLHKFGPVQPMDEPSIWRRIFGRNG